MAVVPTASVARLLRAVVPPTAPPNVVASEALTVREYAPSKVDPNATSVPVSVVSAVSVTASE